MSITIRVLLFFIGFFYATIALPANLIEVYKQALASDPTFQSAQATYLSATQAYPQARALLFPQLSFSTKFLYNNVDAKRDELDSEFRSTDYTITYTQPIFDFGAWSNLHIAKSDVKAAAANFATAQQELILRTATAYFTALEAEDNLRFTRAEKKATARQLDQAEQRFKVGLDAITSVYDARASYDLIVAQEIADKNNVVNTREELREITGRYYKKLAKLRGGFPLVKPQPANVERWVNVVDKQNLAIIAASFATDAARDNIKLKFSGHLPTVDAIGSYEISRASGNDSPSILAIDRNRGEVGLQLNLPIYQGGLVVSQTKQARYDYQKAVAFLEKTHRDRVVTTRQTYNDITAGISKIKADKQAIVSRESSVKSQEAALEVGTRTIVDVLNAQRELFRTQKDLATDQYKYINDSLQLKSLAGTLNINDIRIINSWLASAYQRKSRIHPKAVPHQIKISRPKKRQLPTRIKRKPTAKKQPIKQSKNPYTIQLMASPNKQTVHNFVKKYHLESKVNYRRVRERGQYWYVAFYGNYPSRNAARLALQKLPPKLRRLHPWIRRIR